MHEFDLVLNVPRHRGDGSRRCGYGRFVYANQNGYPSGIVKLKLAAGVDGKAKFSVRAKGRVPTLPDLPLTSPATVQLQATNGECWEATFPAFRKNDGTTVKGISGVP